MDDLLKIIVPVCCVAGFPFPLWLDIFGTIHREDPGVPGVLILIFFLAYAGTCLGSALSIRKAPRLAQGGLIALGVAWAIPWFLNTFF